MEVPKLDKIVINMGVGEAKENAKVLDSAVRDLRSSPVRRLLPPRRRSLLLTSKSREGMAIGCKVTCAARECTNLDRLVNLALPRVRDFRGVP